MMKGKSQITNHKLQTNHKKTKNKKTNKKRANTEASRFAPTEIRDNSCNSWACFLPPRHQDTKVHQGFSVSFRVFCGQFILVLSITLVSARPCSSVALCVFLIPVITIANRYLIRGRRIKKIIGPGYFQLPDGRAWGERK